MHACRAQLVEARHEAGRAAAAEADARKQREAAEQRVHDVQVRLYGPGFSIDMQSAPCLCMLVAGLVRAFSPINTPLGVGHAYLPSLQARDLDAAPLTWSAQSQAVHCSLT